MSIVIAGIDPGSQFTGFGALEAAQGARRGEIRHLEHCVFTAPAKWDFVSRVAFMHENLVRALARAKPHVVAIEKIFLGRNVDSVFKLGHVRGVCLLAARQAEIPVFEYAARTVKKGISGNGASSKEQVQMILFAALGLSGLSHGAGISWDASDALALAYHHARNLEVVENLRRGVKGFERDLA